MAKKKQKKEYLVFIDTNIFLDFYRVRSGKISLKYLDLILRHKDKIITTSQVEMEFKKNRQIVLLESISKLKTIGHVELGIPVILSLTNAADQIQKNKKDISKQQFKLKTKIEKIFKNPNLNDPVYKVVQKLQKTKSAYILDRQNKDRFKIRDLANKRFLLGYPPRKDKDTSYGDAINWEWIIKCAAESGKDIVIVSRDSDYGVNYSDEIFINDWLSQEFKQRVSQKRKIILTDKLHEAFGLLSVTVSKEMKSAENHFLSAEPTTFKYIPENVNFIYGGSTNQNLNALSNAVSVLTNAINSGSSGMTSVFSTPMPPAENT